MAVAFHGIDLGKGFALGIEGGSFGKIHAAISSLIAFEAKMSA
jgi:hypothetical protein